jgi:tripeptide aminopeptidase
MVMKNCLDLKLILKNIAVLGLLLVSGLTFACPGEKICSEGGNNLPKWAKPVAPWPEISDNVKQRIQSILSDQQIMKTMSSLKDDEDFTLKENIMLSEITDIKVVKKNGKYYGPGITDDSRGLAVLTSRIRVLNKNDIKTVGDLMFVGTVGEEGNGDLRGVKALLRDHRNVDAFIGLESIPMGAIVLLNTGSVRYEVSFSSPGGHSYGAFGEVPSAIHAMGRAIAKISDIKVLQVPRTTFNVGIVRGGTSVNTISPDAVMEIDMRSDGGQALDDLHKKVLDIIGQAVNDENNLLRPGQPFLRTVANLVKVSLKKIGDRPGGMTPHTSPTIQASIESLRALGQKELLLAGTSTNAGVPISLGIPTVILPPGGVFEGFHSLDESLDPTDGYKGSQVGLLTALAIAGVQGVSQPLINKKP